MTAFLNENLGSDIQRERRVTFVRNRNQKLQLNFNLPGLYSRDDATGQCNPL
jgi:hypothetical protein